MRSLHLYIRTLIEAAGSTGVTFRSLGVLIDRQYESPHESVTIVVLHFSVP